MGLFWEFQLPYVFFHFFPAGENTDADRQKTYQNDSSCRSDEGVQQAALQRQPAAGRRRQERKRLTPTQTHINFPVNDTRQLPIAFPPPPPQPVRGGETCHMLELYDDETPSVFFFFLKSARSSTGTHVKLHPAVF